MHSLSIALFWLATASPFVVEIKRLVGGVMSTAGSHQRRSLCSHGTQHTVQNTRLPQIWRAFGAFLVSSRLFVRSKSLMCCAWIARPETLPKPEPSHRSGQDERQLRAQRVVWKPGNGRLLAGTVASVSERRTLGHAQLVPEHCH